VQADAVGPVHDPAAHKDARRRCGASTDTLAVRANSSGFPASTDAVKADITWNDCSHSSMSEKPSFRITTTCISHRLFIILIMM
jgi:hypothetical protein